MTEEEKALQVKAADRRLAADSIAEAVEDWLLKKQPKERPDHLTTAQICVEILGESAARGLEMKIARALLRLGFEKGRQGDGKRGYRVPDSLMNATSSRPSRTEVAAVKGIAILEGGKKDA